MTDLKSLNRVELEQFFQELGEPKFRAKQVFQWLMPQRSFDWALRFEDILRKR